MQTVARKPERSPSRSQKRPADTKSSAAGEFLLFLVVLAAWVLFVTVLEEFDPDTAFIALFCACLSMFIIKSITVAFSFQRR